MIYNANKVFFLYPHRDTEDTIIMGLIRNELEAHAINDHELMMKLLTFFDNAVIFINLKSGPAKIDWESYINLIKNSNELNHAKIIVYEQKYNIIMFNERLSSALLNTFKIPMDREGDFIKKVTEICENNGARGTRKYVRAKCSKYARAIFTIKIDDAILGGRIHDISICGMACVFDKYIELKTGQKLPDIQLRLRDEIIKARGGILGYREKDGQRLYVIVFDTHTIELLKQKIYPFIYQMLQDEVLRISDTLVS